MDEIFTISVGTVGFALCVLLSLMNFLMTICYGHFTRDKLLRIEESLQTDSESDSSESGSESESKSESVDEEEIEEQVANARTEKCQMKKSSKASVNLTPVNRKSPYRPVAPDTAMALSQNESITEMFNVLKNTTGFIKDKLTDLHRDSPEADQINKLFDSLLTDIYKMEADNLDTDISEETAKGIVSRSHSILGSKQD
jgi:hypothetical protein